MVEDEPEKIENDEDELFERHRFVANPKQTLVRIDKFLNIRMPNVSRSKIQNGIKEKFVLLNNLPIKANHRIHPGDVVTVLLPDPPRDTDVVPEDIPINIVYEDDCLLVVNKPADMVVHPAFQNWTGTLVNALAYHFKNLPIMPNNDGRPGLVHRIDKHTSGLLVIAKSEHAMSHLARQFFNHSIERTYHALVWGEPDPANGTVNVNLGRNPKDRKETIAFPDGDMGRTAITHFETIQNLRYVSLVKCSLETGRTHQIRVHMKYIGHPIFNDATYGGNRIMKGTVFTKYKQFVDNCFKLIPRQALHAKSLGFIHPDTNEFMQFESDLPDDFTAVLEKWEHYLNYVE